jgi:oligoribonuclease
MKLAWIDLETTGLDAETCHILEIALVITDKNLTREISFHKVLHFTDFDNMNEWCKITHYENGLIRDSMNSKYTLEDLRKDLEGIFKDDLFLLAGSSVEFDRRFINKHLPSIKKNFNHRNFDTSVLLQAAKWWMLDPPAEFISNTSEHRAIGDINRSIRIAEIMKGILV